MLKFQFVDYEEQYREVLYPKRKGIRGILSKKNPELMPEAAEEAVQRFYNAVSASDESNSDLTVVAYHDDEEKRRRVEREYVLEVLSGDPRSSSLAHLLEDAIASKPDGIEPEDQVILQLTGQVLRQDVAKMAADDEFPEDADMAEVDDEDFDGDLLNQQDEEEAGIIHEDGSQHAPEKQPEAEHEESNADDAQSEDSQLEFDAAKNMFVNPQLQKSAVPVQVPEAVTSFEKYTNFDNYINAPVEQPIQRLSQESALGALGLNRSDADELNRLKVQVALKAYQEHKLDGAAQKFDADRKEREAHAVDDLRTAYKEVNATDVKKEAEDAAKAEIDEYTATQTEEIEKQKQKIDAEAETSRQSVDADTRAKLEAFQTKIEVEASQKKNEIDKETNTRKQRLKEQLNTAIAEYHQRTVEAHIAPIVTNRNAELSARKVSVIQKYVSDRNDSSDQATEELKSFIEDARNQFPELEEKYKQEKARQEDLAMKQKLADEQARATAAAEKANEEAQRANDLTEKNRQLEEDQKEKDRELERQKMEHMDKQLLRNYESNMQGMNPFYNAAPPQVIQAPSPEAKQMQQLMAEIKKMQDDNAGLEQRIVAMNKPQPKKNRALPIVASVIGGVLALGLLGGGGVLAYDHIQAQQQTTNARLATQLDKVAQTANQSGQPSLDDLIQNGEYNKAAKTYTSVSAINKITDAIFTNGTEAELKAFVAEHPSTFGKLDAAIMTGDNVSVKKQYDALDAADQNRMSTVQKNAVTTAQKAGGSNANK